MESERRDATRPRLFQQEALQRAFDEDGFVRVPLLEGPVIEEVARLGHDLFRVPAGGEFSMPLDAGVALRTEFSRRALALAGPCLSRHLVDYRLVGASYFVKGSGPHSAISLHQAMTWIDESRYVAVEIWVPLTASGPHNGTLHVVPGSHRRFRAIRAGKPAVSWARHEDILWPVSEAMTVEAGEAVVLDMALVHGSPPNLSGEQRPTLLMGACSAAAQALHYHPCTDGSLERFEMDDGYQLRFPDFSQAWQTRPASGRSSGFVRGAGSEATREEVEAWVRGLRDRRGARPRE